MQVRFTNTRADLLRFHAYHCARSPILLLIYAVLAVSLAHSVVVALRDMPQGPPRKHEALVSFILTAVIIAIVEVVGFGILVAVNLLLLLSSLRRKSNRAILTEHLITLTDGAVIEETRFGRSETSWTAIPKVRQNGRYIFLYTAQNSAHVIPKAAFASLIDAAVFYQHAVTLRDRANTPGSSAPSP